MRYVVLVNRITISGVKKFNVQYGARLFNYTQVAVAVIEGHANIATGGNLPVGPFVQSYIAGTRAWFECPGCFDNLEPVRIRFECVSASTVNKSAFKLVT